MAQAGQNAIHMRVKQDRPPLASQGRDQVARAIDLVHKAERGQLTLYIAAYMLLVS
ncbi:MAG: hypothetical protein NVS2B12_08470 [Ktedonobacteraceae bacterium]